MSIKIKVPPTYYRLTENNAAVEVEGKNVVQCLEHLVSQFPEINSVLFDKRGNLLNYVNIYVNGKSAYPNELSHSVINQDEIQIALVIGGG